MVPAAASVPVVSSVLLQSTNGFPTLSLTCALTPAQSQARARAVRLLREAASSSSAVSASDHAAALLGGGAFTYSSNNMNSGELAFAAEKLAMEELGGPAQPRYLEFVTRLAAKLKV